MAFSFEKQQQVAPWNDPLFVCWKVVICEEVDKKKPERNLDFVCVVVVAIFNVSFFLVATLLTLRKVMGHGNGK